MFGQFNGESCHDSVGDRQACVTDAPCDLPPPPECSASEFQCESGTSASLKSPTVPFSLLEPHQPNSHLYTGSCIKKRLECNGDYDCEDGSDEDCEPLRKPCTSQVQDSNEQGRTAGYG